MILEMLGEVWTMWAVGFVTGLILAGIIAAIVSGRWV